MLDTVRVGSGPPIVLIHGSATDRTTWSIQLGQLGHPAELARRFTLIAYDRRSEALTVEVHADDAATLIDDRTVVVGSSFGAVIALDVVRRYRAAGAVLIEPPMPPTDEQATTAAAVLEPLDRRAAEHGDAAAAEQFMRTVLGDEAYEKMPRMFRDRSLSKWPEIRADSVALFAYRPRYAELRDVRTPVLLLGGDRSGPLFRPTLDALLAALPNARLEIVSAAGHMLHADAHRRFGVLVADFAAGVAPR